MFVRENNAIKCHSFSVSCSMFSLLLLLFIFNALHRFDVILVNPTGDVTKCHFSQNEIIANGKLLSSTQKYI